MTAEPMPRLLTAAAMCARVSLAAAQDSDPLAGTWQLNVAQSKYAAAPPPKTQTTTLRAVDGGLHESVERSAQMAQFAQTE